MDKPSLSAGEFEGLIKKNFQFLVDEYGFIFNKVNDWTYDFESQRTRIHILSEHALLLSISIEPIGEAARELLQRNISPGRGLGLVIISMCLDLELKYRMLRYDGTIAINIPIELEKQVQLLKKYCQKMLLGDFSEWEQIEVNRKLRRNDFVGI